MTILSNATNVVIRKGLGNTEAINDGFGVTIAKTSALAAVTVLGLGAGFKLTELCGNALGKAKDRISERRASKAAAKEAGLEA